MNEPDGSGDPIKIVRAVVEVMTIAFEAMVAKGVIEKDTVEQLMSVMQIDAQAKGELERAAVFWWLRTYLQQPGREELLELLRAAPEGRA